MPNSIKRIMQPIGKLILFLFLFLVFSSAVYALGRLQFLANLNDQFSIIIFEPLLIIALLLATYCMHKWFPNHQGSYFFPKQKGFGNQFIRGAIMGFLLITVCSLIAYSLNVISFSAGSLSFSLFLIFLVQYLIVAFFEELLFRCYALSTLTDSYPIVVAVSINGLLFGLIHFFNPGFNALAMLNISLAGILFALFTFYYQSVTYAIGIHFAWNFTQGAIFGFKVSGTDSSGILTAKPTDVYYLSGGNFGIESSIICTFVLVLMILYGFWKLNRKLSRFQSNDEITR